MLRPSSLVPQAQPQESSPHTIQPIEVWTTLTHTQQHTVLQMLVTMCQDCLLPKKETNHDPVDLLTENHANPS